MVRRSCRRARISPGGVARPVRASPGGGQFAGAAGGLGTVGDRRIGAHTGAFVTIFVRLRPFPFGRIVSVRSRSSRPARPSSFAVGYFCSARPSPSDRGRPVRPLPVPGRSCPVPAGLAGKLQRDGRTGSRAAGPKMRKIMIPWDFFLLLAAIFAVACVVVAGVHLRRRWYLCRLQDLHTDRCRVRRRG